MLCGLYFVFVWGLGVKSTGAKQLGAKYMYADVFSVFFFFPLYLSQLSYGSAMNVCWGRKGRKGANVCACL
jgi:hypothetical protein